MPPRQIAIRYFGPLRFFILSVVIGIGGGLGAVFFRGLIALFHNLLFLRSFSLSYDANSHTAPSPWGAAILFAPAAVSFLVTFLVKRFAPEAKGHGVPEVIDAIYYTKGVIRPIVAAIKSLVSALSIGSGGSVGREGPIIQIGSALGSGIGQVLALPPWQKITLIACGAGAGISATFNTPIGGVLFAVEIILHEVSVKTLVPVAISTAIASYTARVILGPRPSFVIPMLEVPYFHYTKPLILVAYAGLGAITGLVSTGLIRFLYGFEDAFNSRFQGHDYFKHMSGMLLVGLIFTGLWATTGHYYVEGIGYATVQDILSGTSLSVLFLLLLGFLKLIVTSLTLGSGGSGGIFSPSLFIGATLGSAYGKALSIAFPNAGISAPAFAVVGMAGVVGGATGAAVTAIVMVFEMTLDYSVVVPMTITVALSYGLRTLLSRQSIYTMKLFRRGHDVPDTFQANVFPLQHAKEIVEPKVTVISSQSTGLELEEKVKSDPSPYFVVDDRGKFSGVLALEDAVALLESQPLERRAEPLPIGSRTSHNLCAIESTATVSAALAKMRWSRCPVLLMSAVPNPERTSEIRGIITKRKIAELLIDKSDLFSAEG